MPGQHRWRSECSDGSDAGLHGVDGTVRSNAYEGDNPLFRHGPMRVAPDRRHFEHADGTPFFWLGDTWWMGLCHRLHWPDEFQQLAADRKAKGFNVIQIVAGLYPDMHPFDPRGANEAGFPWEEGLRPHPARIFRRGRPAAAVSGRPGLHARASSARGATSCRGWAWRKLKAHWRYLIARYGAWPVVWCAAGEANLPWYLAKGFPYDDREQVQAGPK